MEKNGGQGKDHELDPQDVKKESGPAAGIVIENTSFTFKQPCRSDISTLQSL